MGVILTMKQRIRKAEAENERLQAQLSEANEIIAEQADALVELAGIIEEGEE